MYSVVHNTTSIGPLSFGVGLVPLNMVREQRDLSWNSRIFCLDTHEDVLWASKNGDLAEENIVNFSHLGPRFLGYSPAMERSLKKTNAPHILHQHGIWTGTSMVTNKWRKILDRPTVVAPHGSLEPWCLKISSWKKKLALVAYEKENLSRATCLHCCSEQEYNSLRQFGLKQPIAIIPNGIDLESSNNTGDSIRFRNKYNILNQSRILLYLSRVHPIKGLPLLINAISQIAESFEDWVLVIAGIDENGHESELKQMVTRLGLRERIKFIGPLFGEDKTDAFTSADLFILPSHSENFGVVVIEALYHGVPVITTKGTPWKELADYQCGWWTDVDSTDIANKLTQAIKLSPKALKEMGRKGKCLVETKYSWKRAAELSIELYEWLLAKHDRPQFVIVD